MDEQRIQVRVSGRVQGVGYRAWVGDEAKGLGLAGWVRNEADGSVSALLVGPSAAVERMIAAMRRGPPHAAVASLESGPAPPGPRPPRFSVLP